MPLVAPLMRAWDANSSLRVDHFVANSHHVASRIAKYYRRSSVVLHPPVAVAEFAPVASVDDFYLCAGQIVPYKRVDLAVRTFTKLKRNLVVVGDGDSQDIAALKRIAGPTIRFTGPVSFTELKDYLARCRALIFPGEEDFGIVPVEAMASGRPVIAYGRGGALDTIVPGHTGVLFKEQTVESLTDSIELFETMEHSFYPELIQLHAAQFSVANFKAGMKRIIDQALSERHTVVDVKPYATSLAPVFEGVSHAPLH